jgi:purine-binding chemotaxis protein CheW
MATLQKFAVRQPFQADSWSAESQAGKPDVPRGGAEAPRRFAPSDHLVLVVFHLGNQAYGLPVQEVEEIVFLPALARLPTLPAVLGGFLNLRGQAVPVLRLDRLLERPEITPGRYTPLLLLRDSEYRLALLVEKVSRVLSVAREAVVPVRANDTFNDCVTGMATIDGHVVLLLSAERLLVEKEQQCLAEFQDREQARWHALEEPLRD